MPFLVSVWLLPSTWLCVRPPAILPKPCVSVLLSGRSKRNVLLPLPRKKSQNKAKQNTTIESTLTTYKSDWLKFSQDHLSPLVHPWPDSRLNLTHTYSNAAAKYITELLKTDSQSVTSHPHWSNPIIFLQRFHLQWDNFKILCSDILLW